MAKHLLFEAVRKNNLNRVRFLIESCIDTGSDISDKNIFGATALHMASDSGHLEIVKLLVEAMSSEFSKSSEFSHELRSKILEKDDYGGTALHFASSHGHFEIVKFLIESMSSNDNNDNKSGLSLGSKISEKDK